MKAKIKNTNKIVDVVIYALLPDGNDAYRTSNGEFFYASELDFTVPDEIRTLKEKVFNGYFAKIDDEPKNISFGIPENMRGEDSCKYFDGRRCVYKTAKICESKMIGDCKFYQPKKHGMKKKNK